MTAALAGAHLAGLLDGAAEQQQLLGDGGLAGVRVADDGEGAPFVDFDLIVQRFHSAAPCKEKAGQARLDISF